MNLVKILHDSTDTQDRVRARCWSVTLSISLSNDRQSHGSLPFKVKLCGSISGQYMIAVNKIDRK